MSDNAKGSRTMLKHLIVMSAMLGASVASAQGVDLVVMRRTIAAPAAKVGGTCGTFTSGTWWAVADGTKDLIASKQFSGAFADALVEAKGFCEKNKADGCIVNPGATHSIIAYRGGQRMTGSGSSTAICTHG
jgi:hypothetical protein